MKRYESLFEGLDATKKVLTFSWIFGLSGVCYALEHAPLVVREAINEIHLQRQHDNVVKKTLILFRPPLAPNLVKLLTNGNLRIFSLNSELKRTLLNHFGKNEILN